jgi:hypothetical protein
MPKARAKPIINPNQLGQEGSINELLGQPILKDSLDSSVLALTSVVNDLDMAIKKGVTADHRRLLVWKARNQTETILKLLDIVSKCHSVSQEKL